LTISSSRLYQLFKYAVYALLTLNIFLFYVEESAAAPLQYPGGIGLDNFREAYSATIDTLAWVILLLMFELETWVLEDEHFTRTVRLSLHGLRAICYIAIVMAFTGYIDDMLFVSATTVFSGASDLCALPAGEWSWASTFGEYVAITADNCANLSAAGTFLQFEGLPVLVDAAGHTEIVRLAWVDVINAGVWLLVVLVLEVDVRLQEHHRFEGPALYASNAMKFILYATLFLAAVYWGIKGDFVDFWDAFLWLVAFIFIEMNVFEWRAEENLSLAQPRSEPQRNDASP
jgi:hypothetical protein